MPKIVSSLKEFFEAHPNLRVATKSDSDEILKFFNESQMQSDGFQVSYVRQPTFFEFLNKTTKNYVVIVNSKGPIKLVATVSIREGYIDGVKKRIAYCGDLRATVSPMMAVKWKRAFNDIVYNIKNIKELNADIVLTAILANNIKAKKALTKDNFEYFSYKKLCDYEMVNILYPIITNRLYDVKIQDCDQELEEFYLQTQSSQYFAYDLDFIKSLANNFIVVRDKGQIVGASLLWNPSPSKEILIQNLPLSLKFINKVASIFTTTPKQGEFLKIEYLNFLRFKNGANKEKIFMSMIDLLKSENLFNQKHMLSFANFKCESIGSVNYILQDKTALELYQICAKDEAALKLDHIPGFEISLV
jgi:hypothetical protein